MASPSRQGPVGCSWLQVIVLLVCHPILDIRYAPHVKSFATASSPELYVASFEVVLWVVRPVGHILHIVITHVMIIDIDVRIVLMASSLSVQTVKKMCIQDAGLSTTEQEDTTTSG